MVGRTLAALGVATALHLATPTPAMAQLSKQLKNKAEEMAARVAIDAPTQGIYFDTGSDRIRPESAPMLREIAALQAEHPGLRIVIEGHADTTGSAAANQVLSERRAAAVRDALVATFGADPDRLSAKGLGATKPAATNATPEGRQVNRRVELAVDKE